MRPWKASDHLHAAPAEAKSRGQSSGIPNPNTPEGLDDVTLTTWKNKCVLCHGQLGRGNGPQAAMFQPQDLTNAEFQNSVDDARLLSSIQKGRNKMPGFNLPDATAKKLVKLVRLMGKARTRGSRPSVSATATTAPTAPPPTTAAPAPPPPAATSTATAP